MTDFVQALAAALATIRASVPHDEDCHFELLLIGGTGSGCDCTWAKRVDQAQAERWAASVEAGAEMAIAPWSAALLPGDLESVRGAALRAAKGEV